MKFRHLLWLAPAILAPIAYWTLSETPTPTNTSSEVLRRPTETQIRWKEEEDEDQERLEREEWMENMHRTAPGVSYKAMDAKTRAKKGQQRPGRLKSGTETFANGILQGEWTERGSINQSGRVHVAVVDNNTDMIYCGSSGGNVWKGGIDGSGWHSLNDQWKFPNIKNIALVDNNGTQRIVVPAGDQVFYSDDDGMNWQTSTGLDEVQDWGGVERAVFVDDSVGTIYILAREWDDNLWEPTSIILRSVDHGTSFTTEGSYPESVYGPTSDMDLWTPYAGLGNDTTYFLIDDSLNYLDDNADKVFMSTLPVVAHGYSMMSGTVTNNGTNIYVYNAQYVYRSQDGGQTWTSTGNIGNNPFFKTSFGVAITDPERLFFGDIECRRSYDGGVTWTSVNPWWEYYQNPDDRLHADIPSIMPYLDENGNEHQFISTDGGLFVSHDFCYTVENLSLLGLNAGQYYSVYTHKEEPQYIYVGTQDQGFQRCEDDSGGIVGFDQVISGDYGHLVSGDNGWSLWMVYPGFADFYGIATTGTSSASWDFNGANNLWLPPLMVTPSDHTTAYMAGGNLNGLGSKLIQLQINGNSINASEMNYNFALVSGGGNVSAMAYSPIDDNHWYVMTDNGHFFHSEDAGASWDHTNAFTGPAPHYFYGATIVASKTELGKVYVGGSGYSNPGVYMSDDHGATFSTADNGLPSTLVYDLDINDTGDLVFAATEVGPYVYVAADDQWYDLSGACAPDQTYWGVEYVAPLNKARFWTYGRGIWDFEIQFLSGVEDAGNSLEGMNIFPNPAQDIATLELPEGIQGQYTVNVFDVKGQLMLQHSGTHPVNQLPLDVSSLAAGNYVVQLETADAKATVKLIKE